MPSGGKENSGGDTHQVEDMVKLCTFYDPDGNALMLAQQLKA